MIDREYDVIESLIFLLVIIFMAPLPESGPSTGSSLYEL